MLSYEWLEPEVVVTQGDIGGERRGVRGGDDPAQVEHHAVVGDRECAARFCSTKMMVMPCSRLSRTTRSMTCAMTRGARPSEGSSSNTPAAARAGPAR